MVSIGSCVHHVSCTVSGIVCPVLSCILNELPWILHYQSVGMSSTTEPIISICLQGHFHSEHYHFRVQGTSIISVCSGSIGGGNGVHMGWGIIIVSMPSCH